MTQEPYRDSTTPRTESVSRVLKRDVYHGDNHVATIYGVLNDMLYVPPHIDWRPIMWPQLDGRDRYERHLTVIHAGREETTP